MVIIRFAESKDRDALYKLARNFATSFAVEESAFQSSFAKLQTDPNVSLVVAEVDRIVVGYLLGFDHLSFYANGRIAWVEEIMVETNHRRKGIGRSLMNKFEQWAQTRGSILVALATRRAASFYKTIGYEESATYFRKLL